MKLFPKLALLVLCVALIPLAVIGFSLIRVQRGEMSSLLEDKQTALATAAAERIGRELHEVVSRVVNVVRLVDLEKLGADEKLGLLRAVYRQSEDIVSASWNDVRVAPNVEAEQLRALDGIAETMGRDPAQTERQLMRLADYLRLRSSAPTSAA